MLEDERSRGGEGKIADSDIKTEVYLTMRTLITSALVRSARQLAERYIWTHPSIAETFRCRHEYQASFKKTWLSLMWGGEAGSRQLRESIAVAISAANQCFY